LDELLKQCFDEADGGKSLLEEILKNSGFAPDAHTAILIFPENDTELLLTTYKYLNEFLTAFHYDTAVFVTSIELDKNKIKSGVNIPICFNMVSDHQMARIIRFSALVTHLRQLKIISLNLHYLSNARNLIGFKDIDIEMLVHYSILGLFSDYKNMGEQNGH